MLLNLNLCFGPPMISGSGPTCVVRIEEATHGAHVSGPRGLQRICRNGYQEPCGSTHKARQTGFEASISSFTHTRMCTFDTALMHHHQHGIHTCTCKHAYHNHFPLNSLGCYTEVFVMWVRSFNSGLEVLARRDVRRQEVARAGRAFFCRDPRDCVSA